MRLETEFFPQNLVSFYHNSAGCAVRALQIVLFKQILRIDKCTPSMPLSQLSLKVHREQQVAGLTSDIQTPIQFSFDRKK